MGSMRFAAGAVKLKKRQNLGVVPHDNPTESQQLCHRGGLTPSAASVH